MVSSSDGFTVVSRVDVEILSFIIGVATPAAGASNQATNGIDCSLVPNIRFI